MNPGLYSALVAGGALVAGNSAACEGGCVSHNLFFFCQEKKYGWAHFLTRCRSVLQLEEAQGQAVVRGGLCPLGHGRRHVEDDLGAD